MRDLQVGAQSAGYRIEGLAGRGGMGVVYRARHLRLDRVDAVKVIAPELAEDAAFRARFERESRVAARIEHPNVVTIYDADEEDGRLYLAMRYVEGTDLREELKRCGRLQPGARSRFWQHAAERPFLRLVFVRGERGGSAARALAASRVHAWSGWFTPAR